MTGVRLLQLMFIIGKNWGKLDGSGPIITVVTTDSCSTLEKEQFIGSSPIMYDTSRLLSPGYCDSVTELSSSFGNTLFGFYYFTSFIENIMKAMHPVKTTLKLAK